MTVTDEVVETKLEEEFYIGEEGTEEPTDDAAVPLKFEDGTEVARGSHAVPKGVAVEELKNYGGVRMLLSFLFLMKSILCFLTAPPLTLSPRPTIGHKELKNSCPDNVRKMLQEKDLFDAYDKFVQAISDTKATRGSFLGKWKDQQFISVLDQFRDEFTAKGVKVAFCKRGSGKGTFRWLEFIDMDELDKSYVPQYDVSNFSGQVSKTVYCKLQFPKGVAVEELKLSPMY